MRLRSNVAAILLKQPGMVLVCERNDFPGAWQFPQGGVKDDETLEAALARELQEELSLLPEHYIVRDCRGPYEYLFSGGRKKRGYDGQRQHYFLVDFQGTDEDIDVATADPEFTAVRWIEPEQFDLHWLPEFKRDVYRTVFWDFFGLAK